MENINPSFSNNNIPIVFSCDNNYAPYLAVAIQSVIETASNNNNYDIFVLDEDFSQDTKNKILLQIKNKPNVNITFVAIKHYLESVDINKLYLKDWAISIYYRLFIPRIFNNFSKVIYLDTDIVAISDIAELYNIDLQNKILAATTDIGVIEQFSDYVKTKLNIEPTNYIQSGVLVIDLQKAREHNFEEACINKLNELKKPKYPDQDVISALYHNNHVRFHLSYNLTWGPAIFSKTYLQQTHLPIVKEYLTAYKHPKIIHYASYKPWQAPHFPLANYFWQYAKNTPFYEEILFTNLYKHISHFVQTYNNKQLKSSNQVNNFFNFALLYKANIKIKKLLKYKILTKITFGKLSKKYNNKYNEAKLLITREATAINNN